MLPVSKAYALDEKPIEQRWLIDGLWSEQAVGIVGGEPKCCKSFLALDMAVAVASGTPCLRRYRVPAPGRALVFPAEDPHHVVRERLSGIANAAGIRFADLDVHVITAPTLRLDIDDDRQRLRDTIAALRPRLLVLDPFVRLHRIDENASGDVAPILAWLRQVQRDHGLAVVLVHHAKKGATAARAGQALRGSSELHAWGDSNLYLRRHADRLSLTVEHRAAASGVSTPLRLAADGDALALALDDTHVTPTPATESLAQRITAFLRDGARSITELRAHCHVRNATLLETLDTLRASGAITKTGASYALP
jgi:hypothetical protein